MQPSVRVYAQRLASELLEFGVSLNRLEQRKKAYVDGLDYM